MNVHECCPQTHWCDVEKDIEWKLTSLGKKLRRELCLYLSFWWCNKKLEKTHWILWIGNMIAAKIGLEQWLSLAAIDENSCFLASAFFRKNNLFVYIHHFQVSRYKFITDVDYRNTQTRGQIQKITLLNINGLVFTLVTWRMAAIVTHNDVFANINTMAGK